MKKILNLLLMLFTSLTIYSQQHTFTSFTPIQAATGETVTLKGTNFTGVTNVTFGGTSASSFIVVNSTTITAVVGSGTTGSISVLKTGFTTKTLTGFNHTSRPTITGIVTNYGGYWSTNTTTPNTTLPDNTHALLAFTYKGQVFSTGVDDSALSGSFNAGDFRGLPVTLSGTTSVNSGNTQYIIASNKLDGNATLAVSTNVNVKNLTIQSVLVDGTSNKGLDLSTGYTNLTAGSTSNYIVQFIDSTRIFDDEPDIIVTQIAEPTGTTTDTYTFLDASGTTIGTSLSVSLDLVARLGTYKLDLFSVPLGVSFSTAKPDGVSNISNTQRDIRFVAFRLSDFGINYSNFKNIAKLKIVASGKSDVAFVAYNANTIYSQPLITIDPSTDSVFCSSDTGIDFLIDVVAPGETLTYQWEESVNSGVSWSDISGETSLSLHLTAPMYLGNMYRLKVTVVTSGRENYSPTITLSGCLPVELISFNANCVESGINLEWKTASEYNSDYFQIWKSNNGNDWRMIEQQTAAGYSTELLSYNFVDKEISNSYYLLHQVDFDGVSKTYDPIYVNCDMNNILLTKPNPSNNEFSLVVSSSKEEELSNIEIFNSFGDKVFEKEVNVVNGLNTILFNENFENGVYFIKLNGKVLKHIINE